MNNLKHVILGSGGITGTEVNQTLKKHGGQIKLVNGSKKNDPLTITADLRNLQQTVDAVKGSDVIYLTAGITYSAELWAKDWPVIVDNVIEATLDTGARLVFFDNVYMYGQVDGWMTEDTPFNPVSKKGEVRAKLARKILDAISLRKLKALIARSADFYGFSDQSIPNLLVAEPISKGESPLLLLNDDRKHSFTYVKDIGRSIVRLALDEKNFGQTWHLPTDSNVLTSGDFAKLVNEAFGKNIPAAILDRKQLDTIAESNAIIGEFREMLYQNENDYLFSSRKYELAFSEQPTSYRNGVEELVSMYTTNLKTL